MVIWGLLFDSITLILGNFLFIFFLAKLNFFVVGGRTGLFGMLAALACGTNVAAFLIRGLAAPEYCYRS